MRSTDGHQHAVRARLVRLVAVVAVLVGLVILHSPLCADGMSAATHVAMAADVGMPADTHVDHDMPEPGGADGALATCLALVVMVLVAAAALRRPESRLAVRAGRTGAIMDLNAPCARAPSLAELCVLRT